MNRNKSFFLYNVSVYIYDYVQDGKSFISTYNYNAIIESGAQNWQTKVFKWWLKFDQNLLIILSVCFY